MQAAARASMDHRLLLLVAGLVAAAAVTAVAACGNPATQREAATDVASAGDATAATDQPATAPLDFELIASTLGVEGTASDGRYKISVPQEDLGATVDGFRILPPMGATSWVAFAPAPTGAVVMGDLVLREDEIAAVERALLEHGLQVSALHNHFVRDQPSLMFLHLYGRGDTAALAAGVRAALDAVAEQRGGDPAAAPAGGVAAVDSSFDAARIDEILGHTGEMNRGVYKVTVGRPDVELRDGGVRVTTFMGFNTWVALQGSAERAAVAGDFVMLADEVAEVVRALVEHDIEVVALHNHMIHEEPRVFFLHYWGVGPAEELARGLRAALDVTAGAGGGA